MMKNNHWIEISRKIYNKLLNLFPKEHHAEYGADMLQVFTDQCKSANHFGKWRGFVALWVRTLVDLATNIIKEHVASPDASSGILEAVPNKPLPWKGVFLVLIPGLVFFASQIAQLNGEDWFFLMVYRAAYFMIIPVLVVWVWNRKFPIWGLVPLGLLFKTLLSLTSRMQYLISAESNPLLFWLTTKINIDPTPIALVMVIAVYFLIILALFRWVRRLMGIPKNAWIWLGVYTILVVLNLITIYRDYLIDSTATIVRPAADLIYVLEMAYYDLFIYVGFMVLILLGALFSKRHGRLAILLPLGYMLPTIIYGRISNEWPDPATSEFVFMLTVGAVALVYRFLVALAAPLWIVRSATGEKQKRAGAISLVVLLAIQVAFNLSMLFTGNWNSWRLNIAFIVLSNQLITGAGIGLALALYRTVPAELVVEKHPEPFLENT